MNATAVLDAREQDAARVPSPSSKPRRIMLIASHAPSLTILRPHLIRTLVLHGHEVLCLAPDYTDKVRARVRDLGAVTGDYPLARRGLNPMQDLKSLRALRLQMRAFRPDVVMGYTPKPAIYGSIAARLARVPRIVPMLTGLGYAFLGRSPRDKVVQAISRRLYARAFRGAAAIIFHNREDRDQLTLAGVVPASVPTHVVGGSGVDLTAFAERPLPPVGDGGLTFLMIARLLRYKGVVEFCEAAREVRKTTPHARFVLVGPEELGAAGLNANQLEAWSDCVTYLGPQDDVRPHLESCHVFVLPSYDGEGLPRTILEAMAIGRPIITTDTRGCRETVDERVNGCLVPPRDARALADAMTTFIAHTDLLPAMARASRQKAVRRFDVELITREMLWIMLEIRYGVAELPVI